LWYRGTKRPRARLQAASGRPIVSSTCVTKMRDRSGSLKSMPCFMKRSAVYLRGLRMPGIIRSELLLFKFLDSWDFLESGMLDFAGQNGPRPGKRKSRVAGSHSGLALVQTCHIRRSGHGTPLGRGPVSPSAWRSGMQLTPSYFGYPPAEDPAGGQELARG